MSELSSTAHSYDVASVSAPIRACMFAAFCARGLQAARESKSLSTMSSTGSVFSASGLLPQSSSAQVRDSALAAIPT